jgi:hypothetical protein
MAYTMREVAVQYALAWDQQGRIKEIKECMKM